MYRRTCHGRKDPRRCHGRHRFDAAGAKDGTGQKGPRKRVSEKTQTEEPTINKAAKLQSPNGERRPFLPAAGPRGCGRRAARAKEAAGAEWRWQLVVVGITSICASRLAERRPLRGAVVRRGKSCRRRRYRLQSPGRRDRDWPRREGYPQPGRWQHDVADSL